MPKISGIIGEGAVYSRHYSARLCMVIIVLEVSVEETVVSTDIFQAKH